MTNKHGELMLGSVGEKQAENQTQEKVRKDSIFALAHEGQKHIGVTHVTIRQSIVFLLIRLILLDLFATLVVLAFFSPFFIPISIETKIQLVTYNVFYFGILAALKILITIFVVLQWLNDYYEITPEVVTHKWGIIWQKNDSFKITHIKNFGVRQGIFGRAFNYGTLHFYDWFMKREYLIYQIHNPHKYLRILEDLLPFADEDKELVRRHIVEPGDE